MNRYFGVIERLLLAVSLVLLVFFYVYVYGFGKIRGPLAREEFYELGELKQEEVDEEKTRIESRGELKPGPEPADTSD
jgi:hypothetical protein